MKKPSPILLALLLGACGGGSHGGDVAMPAPAPAPSPASDPFFVRVSSFVGQMAEDTEAVDVTAVVATTPEDAEPPGL
jgi:hypothetical protein